MKEFEISIKNKLSYLYTIILILFCLHGVIRAFHYRWVCDDAFISFRYAKNLVNNLGLVYNEGERVEGYTNFLWTLIVSGGLYLDFDPIVLSYFLGIIFFIGIILCMGSISNFLKQKDTLFFFPFAAVSYASHKHAQIFATSGLETSLFSLNIILGSFLILRSKSLFENQISVFIFTLAALTRPDGLLFIFTTGLYLLLIDEKLKEFWKNKKIFASLSYLVYSFAPFLIIFLPYWLLRYSYYGWFFPNTFYAKSGGISYFTKGLQYFFLFFKAYYVFILIPFLIIYFIYKNGIKILKTDLQIILIFFLPASLYIFYYTRVGGDFMFARFYLPVISLLFIFMEYLIYRLWKSWTAINLGLITIILTVLYLNPYKGLPYPVIDGVTEENQVYRREVVARVIKEIQLWKPVFKEYEINIAIGGSQALFGYYLETKYVLEAATGLTDEKLAHKTLVERGGQVGHEKSASFDYMIEKKVNLHLNALGFPGRTDYNYLKFDKFPGEGRIVLYEISKMNALKKISSLSFIDFEEYLDNYISTINQIDSAQLVQDFDDFKKYYFNVNDDPKRLKVFLDRINGLK